MSDLAVFLKNLHDDLLLDREVIGEGDGAKLLAAAAELDRLDSDPIPMRLLCPDCGAIHVDEGEFVTKPHHTHACQECGMVWRPAVVHTVGVRFLPGYRNSAAALIDGSDRP